jgi:enoyl-CoA hydratase/carnithine racemase
VNRVDSEVTITLNQPQRRNAYSSRMRLALGDALEVAVFDPSIERVTLRGAGQNFSSGGDLDEFGQFSDPVTAHLLRLSTRVTHLLWNLRQRLGLNLRCEMQGENYGAGVELAAFAGRVSAVAGTTFTLPEVKMGLIPGSGGTASLPLRIGRHRTLLMALTGLPIDAHTALDWGLVDDIIN